MEDNPCPCPTCITFAICKSQMQPYIEAFNRRFTVLGVMQVLTPKCPQLTAYIKRSVSEAKQDSNYKLLPHIHDQMIKVFK